MRRFGYLLERIDEKVQRDLLLSDPGLRQVAAGE
jgi:hypothetical protein